MTRTRLLHAVVAGVVLLAACGADDDSQSNDSAPDDTPAESAPEETDARESTAAPDESVPATEPLLAPTTTTDKEDPAMPGEPGVSTALYEAGDVDTGLQPFIDQAVPDLADRLGVEEGDVTVHAAVIVVWPDSSLGCPEPDMSYAQVPADGSVIELEHDGVYYRYHTGGMDGPFLCEYPLAATPPRTDLDGATDSDL